MMDAVTEDFRARLWAFVRGRVPSSSDADDVVQAELLRLLESRTRGDIESPIAWVLSTARTVIAHLHRARVSSVDNLDVEVRTIDAPDEERDVSRCLRPLLAGLDAEDRLVLERIDMGSERQAQVATELGLTPTAMKSRVQRARARLRESVFSRCRVDRDAHGMPTGPASCKPAGGSGNDRGCGD